MKSVLIACLLIVSVEALSGLNGYYPTIRNSISDFHQITLKLGP